MGNTQKLGTLVNGLSVDASGNVTMPTNNVALLQKNAAGTGTIGLLRVDGSNKIQIGDGGTINPSVIYMPNGNFGIGTASPNYLLHINSSTTAAHLQLTNSSTGSTSGDGARLFISGLDVTLNNREAGFIAFETTDTERVRITSSGNVGIGISNPIAKLNVNGMAQFGSTTLQTSGSDYVFVGQNSAAGPDDGTSLGLIVSYAAASGSPMIKFTYQFRQNDNSGANLYGDAVRVTKETSSNSTYTTFYTNSTIGAGIERLRIGLYGDVGAMTAVTGQGSSQGNYRNFYWGSAIIMSRDAYDSYLCGNVYYDGSWRLKYASAYGNVVNWYSGEYSFQRSNTNGAAGSAVSLTATFYIDYNGNVVARGSVSGNGNPSDINLKENLVKISSPLEKISQINGYNFDWKQGSPANGLAPAAAAGMEQAAPILNITQDAGLIAQEVEEIMPELVRENGHKSLNYNGITALLVECIKELKAEIDILKNK